MNPDLRSAQFVESLAKYAIPLGLRRDFENAAHLPANRATFTLVKTRLGPRYLTCHHVVEDFLALQKESSEAHVKGYLSLPGKGLNILGKFTVVGADWENDLAIYERIDVPDTDFGSYQFADYESMVSRDVKPGDEVAIVGYPSGFTVATETSVNHGIKSIQMTVNSVSDTRISMICCPSDMEDHIFNEPPQKLEFNGGMSGSPVFLLNPDGVKLVGVYSQESTCGSIRYAARMPLQYDDGSLNIPRVFIKQPEGGGVA